MASTEPLHEQLEPNLKGGPRSSTPFADLCMLRAKIPKMSKQVFNDIFPSDNTITAVQKSHGVHKIYMSEVAAWVVNATHWFSLLKQPMMIVIWCHNWEDASKFQYLMQILQGVAYSKIVLPSGDSKAECKGRTYCPTTWNYSYQWQYASQYADQLREAKASSLVCKECALLVRIQLSNKSPVRLSSLIN